MSEVNRRNVLTWARKRPWGRDAAMSPDGVLYGCVAPPRAENRASRMACLNFADLHDLAAWAREQGSL